MTRWILPQLSAITPAYIESTLRGAFTGSHIQQWELFDLMEDTWPRLLKNLGEIKRAALALDWKVQPWAEEDAPPSDNAKERAALVSNALWKMQPDACCDENDFEGTLRDLLDAWSKGTSVLEILWHIRQAGKLGYITAPRATQWAHPSNYAWDPSGRLGLNLANIERQSAPRGQRGYTYGASPSYETRPQDIIDFPEDKFLIAIAKAKTGSPLTTALLRPLAWWWCAANFSADWLMNLAQIFGLPFRWANYAQGSAPDTINAISAMLENMGSAAWAAFPEGTTLELKEASKTGDNSPQADLLDRADKNCDLLILGQTGTSEVGGVGKASATSGAATNVHNSVRAEVIQACANFVAGIINRQLIPAICRQNYGDEEECPEIQASDPSNFDLRNQMESYGVGVRAGVITPNQKDEEHFRALANLPSVPPEVIKAWKKQPTREPITLQDETAAGGFGGGGEFGRAKVPLRPDEEAAQQRRPANDKEPSPELTARRALITDAIRARFAAPAPGEVSPADQRRFAAAVARDLAPVRARIDAILKIQDDAIFKTKLAEFNTGLDQLKQDVSADPAAARELEQLLSAAFVTGLTQRNP